MHSSQPVNSKLGPAVQRIQHPTRLLVTGQSQSGKTTLVVDIIKKHFCKQVNRIIMVCPNYERQRTFDPIRHLIQKEDVYDFVHPKTFKVISTRIRNNLKKCDTTKEDPEKILIVVDDVAGNSVIQGRGIGEFSNFAVQTKHWDVSLFVLVQQPNRVDTNFRGNVENVICFEDRGMTCYNWLKQTYTTLDMELSEFKRIVMLAWRGGRDDNKERGKHFLFIHSVPREGERFYIDFDNEINIIYNVWG